MKTRGSLKLGKRVLVVAGEEPFNLNAEWPPKLGQMMAILNHSHV